MEFKVSDKVWTINHSIEAKDYTNEPCRPWQAIVTKVFSDGSYIVSGFDKNDIPDDDNNATAICRKDEVYETFQESSVEYEKAVDYHIDYLKEEVSNWYAEYDNWRLHDKWKQV